MTIETLMRASGKTIDTNPGSGIGWDIRQMMCRDAREGIRIDPYSVTPEVVDEFVNQASVKSSGKSTGCGPCSQGGD